MLLTNHTLTGIVLGLTLDDPLLLAPAAVASHLALDAVPHFATESMKQSFPNHRPFVTVGAIDFTISAAATATACLIWPQRALNIIVGVTGACLPDLVYIPAVLLGRARLFRWLPFYRPMLKFLAWIQWYERPPGAIAEVLWAALMLTLLRGQLN